MIWNIKLDPVENRRTIFQDPRIGRVDIADSENVEKWSRVLGISEYELLSSVELFGSVIADIRKGRRDMDKG